MRFGMILLLLIAVLCIAATAGRADWIYSSLLFAGLFVMLAFNLLLCSVLRVFHLGKQKQALAQRAIREETNVPAPDPAAWLQEHHFKPNGEVYFRKLSGFLGPFITHFSMLLIMLAAACIFRLSSSQDISILPQEDVSLPDGTVLHLDAFFPETDSGQPRYLSTLSATLPDGSDVHGDVSVNHPLKIGRYTIYQQNYAYAAVLGLTTREAPEEELIWLDEPAFLSLDGENGISYTQMFGNVVEKDGQVMISHSDRIINPAYEVTVIDADTGTNHTGLVYPGTEIEAGGITFYFHEPEAYPGLRVKTQPDWTLWLLYLSFALMLLGLYLCFFERTEAAHIKKDGLTIVGRKDISDRIETYREELEDTL